MNLALLFANWKTTAAAAVLVLLSVAHSFGINVPGYSAPDLGTALTVAVGLLFAGDAKPKT